MRYEYRVWDKTKEVMRDVVGIRFPSNIVECMLNSKDKFMWEMYNPFLFDGEHELMQYTGLKDKNGVDIYEGDVLFHPLQGRRKVFYPYSETVASYGLRNIDNGFGSTLQDSHAVLEVIGNIYENNDLLEVK